MQTTHPVCYFDPTLDGQESWLVFCVIVGSFDVVGFQQQLNPKFYMHADVFMEQLC